DLGAVRPRERGHPPRRGETDLLAGQLPLAAQRAEHHPAGVMAHAIAPLRAAMHSHGAELTIRSLRLLMEQVLPGGCDKLCQPPRVGICSEAAFCERGLLPCT